MILGIDPGVASTGWAVLDKNKLIARDVLKRAKKMIFLPLKPNLSRKWRKFDAGRWRLGDWGDFCQECQNSRESGPGDGAIKTAAQNGGVQVFGYTPLQIKLRGGLWPGGEKQVS